MAVDDTQVPRMLLSQGLCIQPLFPLKSSETCMTSHKLVSESLVYGYLEIVNETFCFYMVQNNLDLSIHKGQKSLMRPWMICKFIIFNTFAYSHFLQIILTLKELEK